MVEHTDASNLMRRTQGRYVALLTTLLIIFALTPFVAGSEPMRWILALATVFMFVSALLACWKKGRVFVVLVVFAVASVVLTWLDEAMGLAETQGPGDALRVVFLLMVTVAIFSDVLKSRHVTMNTVFGACCVYLLMSLTWAAVYATLEGVQPGSFKLAATTGEHASFDAELVYFSLITLTTVGYGDITPLTPQARILSALEGLIGQLFIAIIIARLVALEISSRFQSRS